MAGPEVATRAKQAAAMNLMVDNLPGRPTGQRWPSGDGDGRKGIETLELRRFDRGGVGKLKRMQVKDRSINPPPEPPSGEGWLVNDQQQYAVPFKSVAPQAFQALALSEAVSANTTSVLLMLFMSRVCKSPNSNDEA